QCSQCFPLRSLRHGFLGLWPVHSSTFMVLAETSFYRRVFPVVNRDFFAISDIVMDDKPSAIRGGRPRGPGVGDTPSVRHGSRQSGCPVPTEWVWHYVKH